MKRIKIIGIVAALAMVAAACSNGGDVRDVPGRHRRCSDGGHPGPPGRWRSTARARTPTRRW